MTNGIYMYMYTASILALYMYLGYVHACICEAGVMRGCDLWWDGGDLVVAFSWLPSEAAAESLGRSGGEQQKAWGGLGESSGKPWEVWGRAAKSLGRSGGEQQKALGGLGESSGKPGEVWGRGQAIRTHVGDSMPQSLDLSIFIVACITSAH